MMIEIGGLNRSGGPRSKLKPLKPPRLETAVHISGGEEERCQQF
jgi:hypothetical protein